MLWELSLLMNHAEAESWLDPYKVPINRYEAVGGTRS